MPAIKLDFNFLILQTPSILVSYLDTYTKDSQEAFLKKKDGKKGNEVTVKNNCNKNFLLI